MDVIWTTQFQPLVSSSSSQWLSKLSCAQPQAHDIGLCVMWDYVGLIYFACACLCLTAQRIQELLYFPSSFSVGTVYDSWPNFVSLPKLLAQLLSAGRCCCWNNKLRNYDSEGVDSNISLMSSVDGGDFTWTRYIIGEFWWNSKVSQLFGNKENICKLSCRSLSGWKHQPLSYLNFLSVTAVVEITTACCGIIDVKVKAKISSKPLQSFQISNAIFFPGSSFHFIRFLHFQNFKITDKMCSSLHDCETVQSICSQNSPCHFF